MKRKIKRPLFLLAGVFLLLVVLSLNGAFSAANYVPETGLGMDTRNITAEDLKPPECDGIHLDNIVVGSQNGTTGNDLMLGTSGDDTLKGKGGDDCILGGDGFDTLKGNNGDDVIVSNSTLVIIDGGNGNDTCYAPSSLLNWFLVDCETINWR